MLNAKETKTIVYFTAIAFLLPLLCILVITYNMGEKNIILNFILYGVEAASPTIATVAVICILGGRKGITEFFHINFTPKMKITTVLYPIFITFGIMFTSKLIACVLTSTLFQINHLSIEKMIIILWAFLAEEVGWRGLLHKKLMNVLPEFVVPFIVGLIWSVWHYHFFIIGSINVPIFLFVTGCIADSYIYLFLLKVSRGNIVIAMLYHMCGNMFLNIFNINPDMNEGSVVPYFISVIIAGLFGIGLLMFTKKRVNP
jgi:membrane protease YdiL (CAAX protease family)